jgi:hypothetical protein
LLGRAGVLVDGREFLGTRLCGSTLADYV